MYQVAIIGAGQLGSRHLQGLKHAASSLSITVMDSNEESLRVAKERYNAVPLIGEKNINFVTKLENLPSQLDLVIIATGSKPRSTIVKSLLNHAEVKYLVLEKVLFPVLEEYDSITSLLKEKKVSCWVNCPRRMYGLYKHLKEIINPNQPIIMSYADENWGLCCNAIHMIDIFMYLSNSFDYTIDKCLINSQLENSKRSGYIEMTGTLNISTRSGHTLSLTSLNDYHGEKGIRIKNGDRIIQISESENIWSINNECNHYSSPFQSQLTGILADELLVTGGCSLTTFTESSTYHITLIKVLLDKYNEITESLNNKILPIT